MGVQAGIDLSVSMSEQVKRALTIQHPFLLPEHPAAPALRSGTLGFQTVSGGRSGGQPYWSAIKALTTSAEHLDMALRDRMEASAKMVAGSLCLFFLCILVRFLRWADWRLPSLC